MDFIKQFFSDSPSANLRLRKKALNKTAKFIIAILRIVVLLAIGYIIIYPLFYMIVTSLRARSSYYDSARVWIPSAVSPVFNYTQAIDMTFYWEGLKNTLLFEVVAALIEIVTCSIAAYGFARFKFKIKPLLTVGLFLTILIPETMIIIPRAVNYSHLDFFGILGLIENITGITGLRPNIIGSPLAFYLPSLFAMGLRSGLLIFIYMQFFKGLPYELEEAAWVDGAGPIRTYVSIALPSSTVVFTTVTVFSVIWHWNDSFLASMYVKQNYPLSVHLSRISQTMSGRGWYAGQNPESMSVMMAACLLFILPMLIFYMILQRRFIESIDRVGITG